MKMGEGREKKRKMGRIEGRGERGREEKRERKGKMDGMEIMGEERRMDDSPIAKARDSQYSTDVILLYAVIYAGYLFILLISFIFYFLLPLSIL